MDLIKYKVVPKRKWLGLNHELKAIKEDVSGATAFVKEIEKGNLDAAMAESRIEKDLSISLVAMRDQMKKFSLEDAERSWVNEGLAKFAEVLRSKTDNLDALAESVIRQLVSYVKANQGALYLINDDDPDDVFIEMRACYAYDRKKYIEKRIGFGEGLVGQVVLEKGTVYMTDVPKDFIKITSGLGEALPRNILVVPLKLDDQVFGVLEIASFQLFKKIEIEFIEKIGESIASAVSSVKVGERTAKLLKSTTQHTEELKAQEEELRQNMEELSSTQEEMQRILKEVQAREAFISNLINASRDSIVTLDKNFRIINFNTVFQKTYSALDLVIEKGIDIRQLFGTPAEVQRHEALCNRAFAGETFEIEDHFSRGGIDAHYVVSYVPLRDAQGLVDGIAVFVKDVTAIAQARIEAEKQREAMRIQELFITDMLNASTDMIVAIDRDYKVIQCNETLRENYKHLGFDVKKGFDILKLLRSEEHKKHIAIYERAFAGETVTLNEHYKLEDVEKHIVFTFNPVRNEAREVFALAIFAKDVTEITLAKIAVEESARSIKSLMDVSGDSIMTIGGDNKVILSNETHRGSLSHLGIDIRDGFDVMNLFSKEEAIKKQKLYDRVFNGETIEITDHLTINGADLYFLVKHAPLRDVHGNINSIAIFAKDITELTKSRMQAESLLHQTQQQAEELRAQEEELRQNMEEIHAQQEEMQSQLRELAKLKGDLEVRELVFGFTTILSEADPHGTITYVNDKFCEVSGYTREELIGKPHNVLRHPDMPKEVFKKMWSVIKKGETFKGIIKNRAKDGSHYWVDAAIVPVKDNDGKIVKYIGARYHIVNEEMAEQLYKAQFKKSQFASA